MNDKKLFELVPNTWENKSNIPQLYSNLEAANVNIYTWGAILIYYSFYAI